MASIFLLVFSFSSTPKDQIVQNIDNLTGTMQNELMIKAKFIGNYLIIIK
jgi:hypothetical protein